MDEFYLSNFASNKINGKYVKQSLNFNSKPVQKNIQTDVQMYQLNQNKVAIGPLVGYSKYQVYGVNNGGEIAMIHEWYQFINQDLQPEENATILQSDEAYTYSNVPAFILKTPYSNLHGKQVLVDSGDQKQYQCEEQSMHIYQNSSQKWILGEELNGRSSFAKFDSIPFEPTDDYSIRILDETSEDEFNTFPELFAVDCPYQNLLGGQVKQSTLSSHYPVQYCEETSIYLQCSPNDQSWQLGATPDGGSFFKLFPSFPEGEGEYKLKIVEIDEEVSKDEDGNEIDNQFKDEEFPPDDQSMGEQVLNDLNHEAYQWVRASKFITDRDTVLFDRIEPNDVGQGRIGNCWLMAAISALCEFPDQIINNLYNGILEPDADCKQNILLYNFKVKERVPICIDDFIPCEPKNWWNSEAVPLFAQSKGGEIQVNLIEKAFAKFSGQQSNLIGGQLIKALITMTGCEKNIIWEIHEDTASAKQMDIDNERERDTALSNFFHGGQTQKGLPHYYEGLEPTLSMDSFFQSLKKQDENNQIIGTYFDGETDKENGIIGGHAYSVISIHQYDDVKLIKLRNPWGKHEWKGKWADTDYQTWDAYPQIKDDLQSEADDGLFQMDIEDFFKHFTAVEVLLLNMDVKRGQEATNLQQLKSVKSIKPSVIKIDKNELKNKLKERLRQKILESVQHNHERISEDEHKIEEGGFMSMLSGFSQMFKEFKYNDIFEFDFFKNKKEVKSVKRTAKSKGIDSE